MKSLAPNFLEAAEFLGAKLSRDAIWAGKRCNWFGHQVTELRTGVPVVTHRMCGSDYYDGTSGIAVFLGHLYAVTGEKIFRTTSEGAIHQALSRLDHIPRGQRLDFQSGVLGIAYALLELARTCAIEKFNALALLILEEISCDAPYSDDVTPSAIRSLLKIHRDHPRDFLLQTALKLSEHLTPDGEDVSVSTCEPSRALALLELYQATGLHKFQLAAEQAFVYQRQNFATVMDRNVDDEKSYRAKGAAAVGMTLLRAFEIVGNDFYLDEAKSVLRSITHNLPNSLSEAAVDFSPARGLFGQADLLIEAGRILREEDYRLSAELIGAFGIDRYKKQDLPWPCGAANGETPGLMTGLAGIGYGYLRLCDSMKVPPLLMLSS